MLRISGESEEGVLRISGESEEEVLRISGENFSKSELPVDKVAVGSPRESG